MNIQDIVNKMDANVIAYNSLIKAYKSAQSESMRNEINKSLDNLVISSARILEDLERIKNND